MSALLIDLNRMSAIARDLKDWFPKTVEEVSFSLRSAINYFNGKTIKVGYDFRTFSSAKKLAEHSCQYQVLQLVVIL